MKRKLADASSPTSISPRSIFPRTSQPRQHDRDHDEAQLQAALQLSKYTARLETMTEDQLVQEAIRQSMLNHPEQPTAPDPLQPTHQAQRKGPQSGRAHPSSTRDEPPALPPPKATVKPALLFSASPSKVSVHRSQLQNANPAVASVDWDRALLYTTDPGQNINKLNGSLDLVYWPGWLLPHPHPDRGRKVLFKRMLKELQWHRVTYTRPGGFTVHTPRYTTTFGRDDSGAPDDAYELPPKPFPEPLQRIKDKIEELTGARFNSVIINYYADGNDSISYHSDDESFLGKNPTIASLTLGSSRDFYLRRKAPAGVEVAAATKPSGSKGTGPAASRPTEKMVLHHGDLLLMRGRTQADYEHSVPKRANAGGRINMTFRKCISKRGTDNFIHYNRGGQGGTWKWRDDNRDSTIVVLPLLEPSARRSTAAISASAINLVHAIAQGSASRPSSPSSSAPQQAEPTEDADGAASFVYTAPPTQGSAPIPIADHVVPWHISNRYYDADVEIRALQPQEVGFLFSSSRARATASKDVFDALVNGAALSGPAASSRGASERLANRLRGIPAVVLLVDACAPLQSHKRILAGLSVLSTGSSGEQEAGQPDDEVEGGLSGFNLEVSLVAGLAAPQQLELYGDTGSSSRWTSGGGSAGRATTAESLAELYAAEGWEYVDLSGQDCTAGLDALSDGGIEEEELGSDDGIDEAEGLERIREALMTHTWPGLRRKGEAAGGRGAWQRSEDGGAASSLPGLHAATAIAFSDWQQRSDLMDQAEDDNDNDSQREDEAASSLPAQATANATAPSESALQGPSEHATPDEADEALARAFLARISSLSMDATAAGELQLPMPSNPRAMEELEAFLESEDPAWPRDSFASLDAGSKESEEEEQGSGGTWGRRGLAQLQRDVKAFDDDFDDFVSAESSIPLDGGGGAALRGEDEDWTSDDLPPQEVERVRENIFGLPPPLPLQSQRGVRGGDEGEYRDLERQFQEIQRQASRVRAIADPEERRREAALVALAFSTQWGHDDVLL
ncbi:hypothetical protein ACQY0O_001222 [Thecaphora frezii]